MEEQSKEYTGTWIPAYVMEDKELGSTDKILYAEIASFKKCFAGNEFFAKRLHLSIGGTEKALKRLVKKGYIITSGSTTKRILTTSPQYGSGPNYLPPVGELPPSKEDIDNIENTDSTNVESPLPPELEKALKDFELHRKQLKRPLTSRAKELLVRRLAGWYPGDVARQVAAIDQSIEMGWQGVFEVKDDPRQRQSNNTRRI